MVGTPVMTDPAGSAVRTRPAERSLGSRLRHAGLLFLREELMVSLVAIAVGAVLWQIVALLIEAAWLPTFTGVLSHCWQLLHDPAFRSALAESLIDTIAGYGIAVVLGGGFGIAMGLSKYVDWALVYYLDLLLFIPPIVTAPIFLIIFGLSKTTLLAVIVVFSATVIAVNCRTAVAQVDRELLDVSRVFGCNAATAIYKVVLPAASPLIFTGLYLGIGRAVKGMIIGQLFIAVIGLGAYEARFEQAFDAQGIWSIAVIVVAASLALSWLVKFIDGLVNHWAYGG
jgi:NitT/TauT family transport system permease protein